MVENKVMKPPQEKVPETPSGVSSLPTIPRVQEPNWEEQRRLLWESRQSLDYCELRRRWHPLRQPADFLRRKYVLGEKLPGGGKVDPKKQEQVRSIVGTEVWASLTPYQREILSARYLSDDPPSLGALAKSLGITRQGVSQVESNAFQAIAKRIQKTSHSPYKEQRLFEAYERHSKDSLLKISNNGCSRGAVKRGSIKKSLD